MARRNNRNNRLLVGRLALFACLVLCLVMGAAMAMRRDAFALTSDAAQTVAAKRSRFGIGVLANDTFVLTSNSVEQTLEAGKKNDYQITVDCPDTAGVPEGAKLKVKEITEDSPEYDIYLAQAAEALGVDPSYIRLFDITIKAGKKEIEPVDTVEVTIELQNAELSDAAVALHFTEEGAEIMDASNDGTTMDFATESFSVYAIVDEPVEPAVDPEGNATSLEQIAAAASDGVPFYLSLTRGNSNYYMRNNVSKDCFAETTDISKASEWYFEAAGDADDTYYLYTLVSNEKQYIQNTTGNSGRNIALTTDKSKAVVLEASMPSDGRFLFKKANEDKWLQHSNGGGGVRFYEAATDTGNTRFTLTYVDPPTMEEDPYGLSGKTWGIAYHNDTATSAALSSTAKTVSNQSRLEAQDLLMKRDVLDNDGYLLVAENSNIVEWTFTCVKDDTYHITTVVDGETKYLTINGGNVTLQSAADPVYSVIKATPGTGAYAGKWHFSVNGYSLNLPNGASGGYNAATGSGATTWQNLVYKTNLKDDDFTLYKAKKVSVSDEKNVYDGQQVIIYTRVWNETTKRYEFYAIDHDGTLIPCYDAGDNIEWVGSHINTALWDFTEYTNPDGTINYYYELENNQFHNYIAPQVSSGQVLSDATIGLNLNGRRYGRAYTTIIAWDDDSYAYSGLKVENGKVVSCALSESDDFYFAILNPIDENDKLSTVTTINNDDYGITMKMVDFNNEKQDNRDSLQTQVLGLDTNAYGLVNTKLEDDGGEDDGYPLTNPATTNQAPGSLYDLFKGATPVNNLLLQSIYNESGYFEYNSTQNFAHLNSDGTFTVYDQIGSISDYTSNTAKHGQFMPYNDITEGRYCTFTNQTDVLAQELPDTDPRKGEKLYNIGTRNSVDYFFGMEMSASFTQTADGKDAWGHDIIFEFSGDDDFWLYVDGELILDVGGVHSASIGTVNFRTGEVTTILRNVKGGTDRDQHTTLYELFKNHYQEQERGLSQEEINGKLEEIFKKNENGQYVFRDYSKHKMKMFYMERGAGASNLHMRFNLSAVKPGAFTLSKKLSGTDNESNDLIEFPYQIYYTSERDSNPHLLGQTEEERAGVTYRGTTTAVTYKESFTPAGGDENRPYEHVFMLKPGETAEVMLPKDAVDYYVVECGVNPDVYNKVTINGGEATGKNTTHMVGNTARQDYATSATTLEDCAEVNYVNYVDPDAMRTLEVKKQLYGVDGVTKLTKEQDDTPFAFRLYLGNESADSSKLPLANSYPYLVKDPDGNYCRYVKKTGFVAIQNNGSTINNYEDLKTYLATLSSVEQDNIVFRTSPNGQITKIPSGYTVEVRDLIVTTQYKVEERSGEIPKGYTLRLLDGYTRVDGSSEEINGTTPYTGTIAVNDSPKIEVRNQKGWGLTVKKVWTDKDFMSEHDSIYFAVYTRSGEEGSEKYTLVNNTVRELKTDESSLYYFFWNLDSSIPFKNYVVYEVNVSTTSEGGLQYNDDGSITVDDSVTVTRIENGEELKIDGKPVGGEDYSTGDHYSYTVTYQRGKQTTQNENVRTDTVTNSRPGIKLYKTTWDGTALKGAVFTLKDADGNDVAGNTYTSDEDGLITIVYVNPGTYTLTEIETPKGYLALPKAMTITVGNDEDKSVSVSGVPQEYYTLAPASDTGMATITIIDRTADLKVVKVDAATLIPIVGTEEGPIFELYQQVKDKNGNKVKANSPISGYEELIPDNDGVLPKVTLDLPANTYYLVEKKAAPGYDDLDGDLCFTIKKDGTVTINDEEHGNWLKSSTKDGHTSYTIVIPNGKMKKVMFEKVDVSNTSVKLEGAEFDLYRVEFVDGKPTDVRYISGLVSNEKGLLYQDGQYVFDLPAGTYHMVETKAPKGYNIKAEPVEITVTTEETNAVSYDEGTALGDSAKGIEYTNGVYRLLITNTAGYELPATGGSGVTGLYALGAALVIGALIGLRRQYA